MSADKIHSVAIHRYPRSLALHALKMSAVMYIYIAVVYSMLAVKVLLSSSLLLLLSGSGTRQTVIAEGTSSDTKYGQGRTWACLFLG